MEGKIPIHADSVNIPAGNNKPFKSLLLIQMPEKKNTVLMTK